MPEDATVGRALTTLSGNIEGVAELLKSAAHPARLEVLTLLLQGERDFSKLMYVTKLSKTALAYHIDQLIETGLVQRVERGEYVLTADGNKLLSAAASVYRESVRRDEEERALVDDQYSGLFQKTTHRKVISKPATFVPCWGAGYVGSIAGVMRSLGESHDIVDVGGYSGYSFIVNISRSGTSFSGPSSIAVWDDVFKATESLGYAIERYEDSVEYASRNLMTPERIRAARALFDRVKQEITRRDRPVVLWGLIAPVFGIVNGFDGSNYIASTVRSGYRREAETPIPYSSLNVPAKHVALFFGRRIRTNLSEIDRKALERAIRYASGDFPQEAGYLSGPSALEIWAEQLSDLPEEKLNYRGNAYVAACVSDGQSVCGKFLGRLAKRCAGKLQRDLKMSAKRYQESWTLMQKLTRFFPFPPSNGTGIEHRETGAALLRRIRILEEEAIEHMNDALQKW